MKFFCDCSGPCCTCAIDDGCLAGHGDDDYCPASKEQVIERLEKGQFQDYREVMKGYLLARFSINYDELKRRNSMQWIITERKPPKVGESVLACSGKGTIFICKTDCSGDLLGLLDGDSKYRLFTHWMPLPEPPKEKENEKI